MERTRRLRGQDGASMVEFAIVLPLLLLLIYGIISFGGQFLVLQTVKQAASDGARAAIAGTSTGEETTLATNQVKADLSYLSPAPSVSVDPNAPCPNAPSSSGGCISVSVDYAGQLVPSFPGIPTLPHSAITTVLANKAQPSTGPSTGPSSNP